MINGYSICFNEWALDKEIKNELNLLLIISSLCAEKGFCWATNKYLSEIFDTNETTISRKIKKLENKKYIFITYKKRGCEVVLREIRLSKMITVDYQKHKPSIIKNDKENNININNININNNKGNFIKPTIDKIKEYCLERNNNIDPYAFYDFYESKGWYVGKNKMKDWKACIRTWEKRNNIQKADIPSWFNKEIKTTEGIENKEIKELIENYE